MTDSLDREGWCPSCGPTCRPDCPFKIPSIEIRGGTDIQDAFSLASVESEKRGGVEVKFNFSSGNRSEAYVVKGKEIVGRVVDGKIDRDFHFTLEDLDKPVNFTPSVDVPEIEFDRVNAREWFRKRKEANADELEDAAFKEAVAYSLSHRGEIVITQIERHKLAFLDGEGILNRRVG